MNWIQLGGSVVAILILAALAWALGLGREAMLGDEGEAKAAAEDMLSGFESDSAILGLDGRAAIVRGRDGSVAVLKRHGNKLAVRRVPGETVLASAEGWTIDTGERRFGRVVVRTN